MTELAELIEDFKLETHFRDDFVYHVYHECDPSAGRRVLKRREYWKRGKHLGSGGFGSVWLEECVDGRQNGQLRAVKDIQCPRGRVDYTRELEALARFSKGSCARWFCQSFGWYEQDDKIHLTMEYFPLGDLQSYIIRSQEPLPEADAQEITLQIIEGLEFMHKRNFAHRDIKPGNILLQSHPPQGWWIKISDFGLSKRLRESLAVSSSVIGTLAFMSPEQQGFVSSNEETLPCPKAADIWAVGAMAHLLLTKRHLFSVPFELYQYISQPNEYLPLRLLREHIPLEASTFIQAAMTVDPQRRLTAEQALKSPWIAWKSDDLSSNLDSLALTQNVRTILKTTNQILREGYDSPTTFSTPDHVDENRDAGSSHDSTVRIAPTPKDIRKSAHAPETNDFIESLLQARAENQNICSRMSSSGIGWKISERPEPGRGRVHQPSNSTLTETEYKSKTGEILETKPLEKELGTRDGRARDSMTKPHSIDTSHSFSKTPNPIAQVPWIEDVVNNGTTIVLEQENGYNRHIWKLGRCSNGQFRVAVMQLTSSVALWDFLMPEVRNLDRDSQYVSLRSRFLEDDRPLVALSPRARLFAFVDRSCTEQNIGVVEVHVVDMITCSIRTTISVPIGDMPPSSECLYLKFLAKMRRICINFSPDGTTLALCGVPGYGIQIWRVSPKELLGEIFIEDERYRAIAFSPDNRRLVALDSSLGCYIGFEVWDLHSIRRQHIQFGPNGVSDNAIWQYAARTVAFLPDGSAVVGIQRGSAHPIADTIQGFAEQSLERQGSEMLLQGAEPWSSVKENSRIQGYFAVRIPEETLGDLLA